MSRRDDGVPAGEGSEPRRGIRRVLVTAMIAVVLAAGFAGWSGWTWWQARHDDAVATATARDEVLRTGRQAIALFNTLDYRAADEGLARWLDASTGELHDELARARDATGEQLAEARTVTVGQVVDAAVTELEPARGTARIIASVEIEVTVADGEPETKRARQQADLIHTGAGWKLSALGQVPTSPV